MGVLSVYMSAPCAFLVSMETRRKDIGFPETEVQQVIVNCHLRIKT